MPLWPEGLARVPDEPWTRAPVESLARNYDTVENHGWYKNLDPTIDDLATLLRDGDWLIDYSGGTGILADRLLTRLGQRQVGIIIVDSSPKFLRLAVDKLAAEPRLAFRHIRFLREQQRLQTLDEVLAGPLLDRRADALVSTNAIHLYHDLPATFRSWIRCLKPGAKVLVQSGNIANPHAAKETWIIDQTVENVHEMAMTMVRSDLRFAAYRTVLDNAAEMARYDDLRRKYFLPIRPLSFYEQALGQAGLTVEGTASRAIDARVVDWFEFLAAYHEGVLGWVGGTEKISGRPATADAVRDRLALMKLALDRLFGEQGSFLANWTFITCRTPAGSAGFSRRNRPASTRSG